MKESVTIREAARIAGRNPETIRRWVWHGKLRATKQQNQLLIDAGALRALLWAQDSDPWAPFLKSARATRAKIFRETGRLIDVTELMEEVRQDN